MEEQKLRIQKQQSRHSQHLGASPLLQRQSNMPIHNISGVNLMQTRDYDGSHTMTSGLKKSNLQVVLEEMGN